VDALAARGDEVHATARAPAEAAALASLAARHGGRVRVHRLDLTQDESCRALAAALEGAPVERLFNNAGVGGRWTSLDDLDLEEAARAYDVNALGALRVVRALRANLRAGGARVVNVSSTMGSIGDNRSGRSYSYRMSKAALNMATKNLALELEPEGIVVVSVNPGWVKTDMGGPQAPTPVEEAAGDLVRLADGLGGADNGKFLHAKGHELPW
jgi:NAD(P)-dependent dehydrogenase (short-subunit alcohol dehydrogenase family)